MGIVEELNANVEKQRRKNTAYRNYHESDVFTAQGSPQFSVLDFWRFMYGHIGSQSAELAEFMVANALGIDKAENVEYWSAYDMSYRNFRIEVKESEYLHPWNHKRISDIRNFSIAPSSNTYWSGESDGGKSRQSDVYVFCLNTNQNLDERQPLNLDFWSFYVIPTYRINQYAAKDQKTISLGMVRKIAGSPVKYQDLRDKVDKAIDQVKQYMVETVF